MMPASSGIFSLLDLIQRDPNAGGGGRAPVMGGGGAAPTGGGGVSAGRANAGAPGGGFVSSPMWENVPQANDPKNWFLSAADRQSPLAYMGASHVGGGFGDPNWQPNDKGGYFTLDQLYGGNVPELFHQGSGLPSTNNWQLTVPYGGGPGAILRNGQVIYPGAPPTGRGAGLMYDTGPGGPAEGANPLGSWSNPGSGAWAGMPNAWRGATGWPGQVNLYQYDRPQGTMQG